MIEPNPSLNPEIWLGQPPAIPCSLRNAPAATYTRICSAPKRWPYFLSGPRHASSCSHN